MNIAYWLSITVASIFIWVILTMTAIPLFGLIISLMFPEFWNNWVESPIIGPTKDAGKYLHDKILLKLILILFCACVFIIVVLYFLYFIAKYILLKGIITAPIGQTILDFIVIKEFIDIGMFPFFDNIIAYQFPALYGGAPTSPMGTTITNFASSFIEKIKAGDGSESTSVTSEGKPTTNPNLTEVENKTVNDNFEKCIKDNTPGKYSGNEPFNLFMNNLNTTNAKIKCELQKIKDSIEIKNVK